MQKKRENEKRVKDDDACIPVQRQFFFFFWTRVYDAKGAVTMTLRVIAHTAEKINKKTFFVAKRFSQVVVARRSVRDDDGFTCIDWRSCTRATNSRRRQVNSNAPPTTFT